jgi:hypothetical protein
MSQNVRAKQKHIFYDFDAFVSSNQKQYYVWCAPGFEGKKNKTKDLKMLRATKKGGKEMKTTKFTRS